MSPSPALLFTFLISLAFALSTALERQATQWLAGRGSDNLLQVLLGDGRQILANHLFVQADVYFHSGYYPSIFDAQHAPTNSQHLAQAAAEHGAPDHDEHSAQEAAEQAHEEAMNFLSQPRDCIERFGRKFAIASHTHLGQGKEREILPWLRLSADLDPHRIETYTVAAYWLRRQLGKVQEAEQFLREGLRANPNSYEILLELGQLQEDNYHDLTRARNIWDLAFQRWNEREGGKEEPDRLGLAEITVRLARLEESRGNFAQAILWFERAKQASPDPAGMQSQIDRLRSKITPQPRAN
jgi:tetratricopeptide (TPR) repeat protein